MTGWKTWLGAGCYAIGAIAGYFMGVNDLPTMIESLGQALIAIGVAHKIEKNSLLK